MKNRRLTLATFAALFLMLNTAVHAQENRSACNDVALAGEIRNQESHKNTQLVADEKIQQKVTQTIDSIRGALESEKWVVAFASFTPTARQEFCKEQVFAAAAMLQLGGQIPGGGEVFDELKKQLASVGLKDLEIPMPACGPGGCKPGGSSESGKPTPPSAGTNLFVGMMKMMKIQKEITSKLNESGRQEEVAGSIYNALGDIPMTPRVFGKVSRVQQSGKSYYAKLDNADSMQPPLWLRLVEKDGNLKFAGVDKMRTMGEMFRMMASRKMPPAMPESRPGKTKNDF